MVSRALGEQKQKDWVRGKGRVVSGEWCTRDFKAMRWRWREGEATVEEVSDVLFFLLRVLLKKGAGVGWNGWAGVLVVWRKCVMVMVMTMMAGSDRSEWNLLCRMFTSDWICNRRKMSCSLDFLDLGNV